MAAGHGSRRAPSVGFLSGLCYFLHCRPRESDRMQRNPYGPPATTDLELPSSEVPRRRPIAVWLLLMVLCIFTLSFAVGLARLFGYIASNLNGVHNPSALIMAVAWRVGLVAVAVPLIVSIYRGRRWSCWLGLAAILAIIIWNFWRHDDTQYPDNAQRFGGAIAQYLLLPLLFAWWGYAFAFSSKAKRYFST